MAPEVRIKGESSSACIALSGASGLADEAVLGSAVPCDADIGGKGAAVLALSAGSWRGAQFAVVEGGVAGEATSRSQVVAWSALSAGDVVGAVESACLAVA